MIDISSSVVPKLLLNRYNTIDCNNSFYVNQYLQTLTCRSIIKENSKYIQKKIQFIDL